MTHSLTLLSTLLAFIRAARREDAATAAQIRELVQSPALRAACPLPFDEARLLQGEEGARHKVRAPCGTRLARAASIACARAQS